jgi:hypothetical protein
MYNSKTELKVIFFQSLVFSRVSFLTTKESNETNSLALGFFFF